MIDAKEIANLIFLMAKKIEASPEDVFDVLEELFPNPQDIDDELTNLIFKDGDE